MKKLLIIASLTLSLTACKKDYAAPEQAITDDNGSLPDCSATVCPAGQSATWVPRQGCKCFAN